MTRLSVVQNVNNSNLVHLEITFTAFTAWNLDERQMILKVTDRKFPYEGPVDCATTIHIIILFCSYLTVYYIGMWDHYA